jgi:integrase
MEIMNKYDQFFDALGKKSKSTTSGYRTAILKFMHFVFADKTVNGENVSEYVEKYFGKTRDYFIDFKKFIQAFPEGTPPLSALQTFNQIRNFFALSDVPFTPKQINLLKNQLPAGGKGDVVSEETCLTHDIIRSLLKHLDTMDKAAILCLATSGMRIGELLRVKCSDVNLETTPAQIYIRAMSKNVKGGFDETKTKKGRYTFITPETVDAVREWIKVRESYLEYASKQGKNFKTKRVDVSISDNRLFPCSDTTVTDALAEAVFKVTGENAKCPITKRSLIHAHGFRKFFVSQISDSTGSLDFANLLAGHVTALTKTYEQKGPEQNGKKYLAGMHALYIEVPEEIRDIVTIKAQVEKEIELDKEERAKDKEEAQKIRNQTTDATNKLTLYMAENRELQLTMNAMKKENDKRITALQADVTALMAFVKKSLDAKNIGEVAQAHGKIVFESIKNQEPDGSVDKAIKEYRESEKKAGRYHKTKPIKKGV